MFTVTDQTGVAEGRSGGRTGSTDADSDDELPTQPFVDKVFYTTESQELSHPVLLYDAAESRSISVRAVFDSGAGLGYLSMGNMGPIGRYREHQRGIEIQLADGSLKKVKRSITLPVSLIHLTRKVELWILPSSPDAAPFVLFGRSLLQAFRITIENGERILVEGKSPMRSELRPGITTGLIDRVGLIQQPDEAIVGVPEWGELPEGVAEQPQPVTEAAGFVSTNLGLGQRDRVDRYLEEMVEEGWMPLPLCRAVRIRLRRLNPGEKRDTVDQIFTFELDCDLPKAVRGPHLYSGKILSSLTEEQRGKYQSSVSEFTGQGWWERVDSVNDPLMRTVTSPVFGIPKKASEDIRLICDCRGLNRSYPASSKLPPCSIPLMLIRVLSFPGLVLADAAQAFYKVRLLRPIPLHDGSNYYHCHRMAFGLSFGPEGLRCSLGRLYDCWRRKMTSGSGCGVIFVDDSISAFRDKEKIDPDINLLVFTLSRCGFGISEKKFKSLSEVKDDGGAGLLRVLGAELRLSGEFIEWANPALPVPELLARISGPSITKASLFSIAGVLTNDPLHIEPSRRVVGDVLRRVIGSAFSSSGWHDALDFGKLSKIDRTLFEGVRDWALELILEDSQTAPRLSRIPIRSEGDIELLCQTDASTYGGSVLMKLGGSGLVIYTKPLIWKKNEMSYHCNRLELIALYKGLRLCGQLVDSLVEGWMGGQAPPALRLVVETDSRVALAWAQAGPVGVNLRVVEYREITRLAGAAQDEITDLQAKCQEFIIRHVPGSSNEADGPSRLLYRELGGGKGKLGPLLFERETQVERTIDPTRVVAEVRPSLSASLAGRCADIELAVQVFGEMKGLLRAWRERSRGEGGGAAVVVPRSEAVTAFAASAQRPFGVEGAIHQDSDWDGSQLNRYVIPRGAKEVADLIFRSYHRRSAHKGREYTAALLKGSDWFVAGYMACASRCSRLCLTCQMKRAANEKPSASLLPQTVPREIRLSVFSRISIDFLHTKPICLSVMCIDTTMVALFPLGSTSAASAVEGMRRLVHKYYANVKYIVSDQGSAFRSKEFQDGLRKLTPPLDPQAIALQDIQHELTPVGAKYRLSVERLHREVWSVLRGRKFGRHITNSLTAEVEVNERIVEEICYIINQRPLIQSPALITPAKLAFGPVTACGEISPQLVTLRDYFYTNWFIILRRRIGKVKRRVGLGDHVLIRRQNRLKSQFPFSTGRVIGITGSELMIEADRKKFRAGCYEVVPLILSDDPLEGVVADSAESSAVEGLSDGTRREVDGMEQEEVVESPEIVQVPAQPMPSPEDVRRPTRGRQRPHRFR